MDRCYTKVNQIERDAMKATTEVDVLYFKTHGNITEEQLDRSNISTIPDANSVPRDQRPLQNQRAVLISHPETLSRFVSYENHGLEIGNSILQTASGRERKDYRKARNIVAKHDNKEKKKRETKEKRDQLTPEQKKQVTAERKEKAAAKKVKAQEEYEQARLALQRHL